MNNYNKVDNDDVYDGDIDFTMQTIDFTLPEQNRTSDVKDCTLLGFEKESFNLKSTKGDVNIDEKATHPSAPVSDYSETSGSETERSEDEIGPERDKRIRSLALTGKQASKLPTSFRQRPLRTGGTEQDAPSAPVLPRESSSSSLPLQYLNRLSLDHKKTLQTQQSHRSEHSEFEEVSDDETDEVDLHVVEGNLLKKGQRTTVWRRRYVVLNVDTGTLEWYKHRSNYISDEQTNSFMRITPTTRLWNKPNSTCFSLQNNFKEIVLDASTQENTLCWLDALCRVFRIVMARNLARKSSRKFLVVDQYIDNEESVDDRFTFEKIYEEESYDPKNVRADDFVIKNAHFEVDLDDIKASEKQRRELYSSEVIEAELT